VEGLSLREVVLLPGGLNLLHAAGNLTIGMLAALVWHTGPVGLPLLIAPIVLSFFAYRGWLQNKREEEQRRESERMRTLYEAGRALFGRLDVSLDFQPFLALVRRLVDAAGADLALLHGAELRVYSSESGLYLTVPAEQSPPDPAAYIGARPGLSTYLAPVRDETTEIGVLAVHRAAELSPAEQADFLKEMGIARSARDQLVRGAFEATRYISFLTVGEDEVRAWNVREGSTAPTAAGKVHSDMEKGFIRAEVISSDDFLRCGSMAKAKTEGKLRLEGKEYVVKDGEIVHVRFNV